MTRYKEILRLTVTHDYYGNAAIPIAVAPAEPAAFADHGLHLRQTGNDVVVFTGSHVTTLPRAVELEITVHEPNFVAVTEGAQRDSVPQLDVPLWKDGVRLSDFGAGNCTARKPGSATLCTVSIALDGAKARDVTVEFSARKVFWAYYVIGVPSDVTLTILDRVGDVKFEGLDPETLNGRHVQVLRSTNALPVRARGSQSFELQELGPMGAKTLIANLPAAAAQFDPILGGEGLQAKIYVTPV